MIEPAQLFQLVGIVLSVSQPLTFNWSGTIFQMGKRSGSQHVSTLRQTTGPGSPDRYQGRAALRPPAIRKDDAGAADCRRSHPVRNPRQRYDPRRRLGRPGRLPARSRPGGYRRDPAGAGPDPGHQDRCGYRSAPWAVPPHRLGEPDDATARRGLTCRPHGYHSPAAPGPGGTSRCTPILSRQGVCGQDSSIPNPDRWRRPRGNRFRGWIPRSVDPVSMAAAPGLASGLHRGDRPNAMSATSPGSSN